MDEQVKAQFAIKKSWIFSIFLFIPLVGLFGAWDFYFNEQQLLPKLQYNSLFLPFYVLIFELPHVIASFFGFFQKEYIRHYRAHLLFGIPLLLLVFISLVGFSFYSAVLAYIVVTLFHVIRQQTGIAHFFGVPKNRWHWWWSWTLIVGLASIYLVMQPSYLPEEYIAPLLLLIKVTLIVSAFLGVKLIFLTKNRFGAWYIFAAIAMSLVSYSMFVAGYIFLSVLVVRVIHDMTAFLFYINHEMNSNRIEIKNWLYKRLPLMPWSLIFFIPASAVGIGLLLRTSVTDVETLFAIVMTIAFIHYYIESIIWKRDGLHRSNISVQ